MTFWKRAGIICLAWVSVLCVGDLAKDWEIAPDPQHGLFGYRQSRSTTNAGQRGRRRTQNDPALCGRCLQLLVNACEMVSAPSSGKGRP